MSKVMSLIGRLRRDEDGAALIEYTVLLGIMLVAVIATIILVGTWVGGKWTALKAQLFRKLGRCHLWQPHRGRPRVLTRG